MEQYLIYLRKSRADLDAEARGEGETLARHEKALLEVAKRQHLNVTQIYKEVVSGDTIAARPMMQRVLEEVEQGFWTGVLVMEVERLARGDTVDQGIIAETFKYSGTKIVTPIKTYDPNNEYDEEYFEFGLFMSRREYKTINRRLQRGRLASVKEGKYVSNLSPYGYERVRIQGDKGFTLVPVENEAEIIRMIYEWYAVGEIQPDGTHQRIGVSKIARRLNELKIKPKKGNVWVEASIRDILINPVYIGMIRWNWRPQVKKISDGKITVERPRSKKVTITKGLHKPIISKEIFDLAQEYMSKNPPAPVGRQTSVKNPLAGLIICGKCGRHMVRRPYGNGHKDTLICPVTSCNNVSSDLELVESKIIAALRKWLKDYKVKWDNAIRPMSSNQGELRKHGLEALDKDLDRLNKQIDRAHDLLEQGVYDVDVFLDRTRRLSAEREDAKKRRDAFVKEMNIEHAREENQKNIIPKVEHLLSVYNELTTPKEKNEMLKEVLEKVTYTKEHGTRWHGSPDDFEIKIYPKLPKYKSIH